MARMLGRYTTGGCWTGKRHDGHPCITPGPDCSGWDRSTRGRKTAERRQVRAEAVSWRRAPLPFDALDDPTDCAHGCNGGCEESGSERCTWLCHPVGERARIEQWAERSGATVLDGSADHRLVSAHLDHIEWIRAL
jgi:hypothetical protein